MTDNDPDIRPVSIRPVRSAKSRRRLASRAAAPVAAALGVVSLVGGGLCAWALGDPVGGGQALLGLTPGSFTIAADILAKPSPSAADLTRAGAATRAALGMSPSSGGAWLQLAYEDLRSHGRVGPETVTYLQRSYDFEPMGPDVSMFRMRFGFEIWGELTPELRREILSEFEVRWPDHSDMLKTLASGVVNPTGRLAAQIAFQRLELLS